jgi:hypothetical protein
MDVTRDIRFLYHGESSPNSVSIEFKIGGQLFTSRPINVWNSASPRYVIPPPPQKRFPFPNPPPPTYPGAPPMEYWSRDPLTGLPPQLGREEQQRWSSRFGQK